MVADAVGGPGATGASPGPARRDELTPVHGEAWAEATPSTLLDALRLAFVVLDTAGRIVMWSDPAEEMLGWTGEHIVGRRIGSIRGQEVSSGAVADTASERARDTRSSSRPQDGTGQGGQPPEPRRPPPPAVTSWTDQRITDHVLRRGWWKGILPLRHRDGHLVQVEVRANLLTDGDGRPFVLASLVETRRVRALEQDLAVLDSLFQSSPLGIAVFTRDLRHVRANEALARMNNRSVQDLVGRTIAEALAPSQEIPPDIEALMDLQRQVLDTGTPVVDLTLRAPMGTGYHSFSCNRLQDRAGRVLGISATVIDVTERQLAATRVEHARQRLDLLNNIGRCLGELLDVERIGQELAQAVVPEFGQFSLVMLLSEITTSDELPRPPYPGRARLVYCGHAAAEIAPEVERMLRVDQPVELVEDSPYAKVLRSGVSQLIDTPQDLLVTDPANRWRAETALAAGVHSVLVLPLRAHGAVLGLLVVGRAGEHGPFDRDDLMLGTEIADRAGGFLDNARLYAREREGAVMLQRSLLPQHVPAPPGVRVAYRYVPASTGTEVGGDWFDVIPLTGGRVALVVGDVTGHGLQAAATMGRLRTAVRTLSQLELPPGTLLRHINELTDDFGRGPEDSLLATCVYAVYDPLGGKLCMATAGHLPPLLLVPGDPGSGGGCQVRRLDLPSGAPLGVVGVDGEATAEFDCFEFEVPEGAVLVLYTDGLVETRDEDITAGIERLAGLLRQCHDDLEQACDTILAAHKPGPGPDDIALLMASLQPLPADSTASWVFAAEPGSARAARGEVRETLRRWQLTGLEESAVLLVSELVTNSLRHAGGPIGVRLVRGPALLVEVSDPLPDPPRERHVDDTSESGRGLHLVARTARRWGTRYSAEGKVVWFELPLPGN
ncbi:hypothetical protein AQ490_09785 [Wenjunlia vitaminophila]|uniref:protein-serine/threonine phosphatase n=1 Tax=Wenjunlia vitaminophila TaxID=76728 RepID=A0A0T6LLT4_WENVI|nr:hypothetical protein AQ490_09785 [Wenjunlia vitaminophila]